MVYFKNEFWNNKEFFNLNEMENIQNNDVDIIGGKINGVMILEALRFANEFNNYCHLCGNSQKVAE